jgi:starch phosphorylase
MVEMYSEPASVRPVAYFSMDLGLESGIPTYSGGLGVLAGDTLRAAADLALPMVAVSLVHRAGYVRQELDEHGNQIDVPGPWRPEERLEPVGPNVSISLGGRRVELRAWQYRVRGRGGFEVPALLLDADVASNDPADRRLTDHLYGGDSRYRLSQEAILGIGGVRMLRALRLPEPRAYHMNEGHAALLALALLDEQVGERDPRELGQTEVDAVRRRCVFTTHTPVGAGHDQFDWDLAQELLGEQYVSFLRDRGYAGEGALNMTQLALSFSRYVNGVSVRHGEVSRGMFPGHAIRAITNGVHAGTWTAAPFQDLFDRHIPEWRDDNLQLRHAVRIPLKELKVAHDEAKATLIREVAARTGVQLDPDVFTIGFARRSTGYKRPDLVFQNPDELRRIASDVGPVQLVFAGKAHPRDEEGKRMIRRIFEAGEELRDAVKVVYLENYDMDLGRTICSGVDVWLNNPLPPLEASGTSGMKAALNGVPSLSVLDGWWIEGHIEGVTGWAIGEEGTPPGDPEADSRSLYSQLEDTVLPMFYEAPYAYAEVMRSAIAWNGSFFNSQRMVQQYEQHAYRG